MIEKGYWQHPIGKTCRANKQVVLHKDRHNLNHNGLTRVKKNELKATYPHEQLVKAMEEEAGIRMSGQMRSGMCTHSPLSPHC